MNNKGQSLVIFILLLPLILLIFAFIIDIGMINYNTKKIDKNMEHIIQDIFKKNIDETDITFLIKSNIKSVDIKNIEVTENKVQIDIKVKLNTVFTNLIKENTYETTYLGIKQDEEIRIIRK